MDTENKETIDEEAIAEEEFVSDLEDTIENPLVYDGDKLTVQSKKTQEEGEKKEELAGAIGSGELVVNTPFNNEEALRSENMNDGDNPFGSDSTTNKDFDGPDKAPLEDATETIAPSTTPKEEDASNTTETAESEPTESTPIAESEPASTPTLGEDTNESAATSSETPVVSNAPTAENATDGAAEPKKKKKTGLIVGIIVAVLLVGAIIGGVIFYMIHESKEQTVLDAVTNLIGGGSQQIGSSVKTDARQFDGTIKIEAVKDADSLKGMTLAFKTDTKAANFSGSGSLTLDMTTGQNISIDVNAAYISEDGVYFKIDKLKEALSDELLFGSTGSSSEFGSSSMSELNSLIKDIVSSVIEAVDGEWFKIDSKTFENDKSAKESYDCVTKALEEMSSKEVKDKIASIYKSHPFIENDDEKGTSDADGLKYYSVKTSSDKYKAFISETKDLSVVKDFKTCMNVSGTSSSEEESEKVTAEIKLGITGWSHELKVIKGNVKSDSTNMDIDVKVGYEEKSVVAPTDSAKGMEDLTKDFMTAFAKSPYMKSYINIMAKQACASQTTNINAYNACVEEMAEKLTAEMMKSMMGQFVPSATKTSALIQ